MKVAFTKPPYDVNLTWESLRWPGPEKLLDAFVFRSLDFCLAAELEADIWVVEWEGVGASLFQNPQRRAKDPDAPKRVYDAHKNVVKESDVPWGEYDAVISLWPSIGAETIKKYPNTLWCYREIQHRSGRSRRAAERNKPHGVYDLYLDMYFHPERKLNKLPQVVWFPYVQSPAILRELVHPKHEPKVFIESRHVLRDAGAMAAMQTKFERICGLPIRYAPVSGAKTEPISFNSELTRAKYITRTAVYLKLLGSCKYFLIWRGGRRGESKMVGQAALEAAALGLIVVGNNNSIYHRMFCHPKCLIPPGGPPRKGLRIIQQIEADKGLQKEILKYQNLRVQYNFWDKPLAMLPRALEMKRYD